jgi:hypothetical protein
MTMKMLQTFVCLAILLTLPSATPADTGTLIPNRDTTIYEAHPGNSNGGGASMFVGTNADSSVTRALIRFDVAGKIPAGATITGVQLSLLLDFEVPTAGNLMTPIQLRRLLSDWGEGTTGTGKVGAASNQGYPTPADGTTATFTHSFFDTTPWNNPGGDFADTASATTMVGIVPMPYSWSSPTMVSDVQSWLDNPSGNFGWILLGDESQAGTVRRFFTREGQSINPASAPALSVSYTAPGGTGGHLTISAVESVMAGSAFDVSIAAVDSNGLIATGYTGTISFSSTDPFPGLVPFTYMFTSADKGQHTFPGGATFFTAGSQALMAEDTSNSAIRGGTLVQVSPAPAVQLQFAAPQNATSAVPFDVTLTALDPYSNVDTNYAATVTFSTTDSSQGVVVPGPYTFQASDMGTHTFASGFTLVGFGGQLLFVSDNNGLANFAFVLVGF